MGKRKIDSNIRQLITQYRRLREKHGRSNFPGDPYRMKLDTLKSRIEKFNNPGNHVEDIEPIEETNFGEEKAIDEAVDKVVEKQKKNQLSNPETSMNKTNGYSDDFVSISEALSKPSIPIQKIETIDPDNEGEEEDPFEEVNEFNDGAEIDESISEEEDFENEPSQSFMPLGELASLIAELHDHLPLLTSRVYAKVIFEDKGTLAEAKLIDKKVRNSTIKGNAVDLTEKERELYDLYSQVEDYKENAKPNDQTKELLKRAWEIQLRKWGYDNIDVDKHSLSFAYGLLAIQMGLPFLPHLGKIKFRKKKKK